jgi:hypothetical protein
MIQQNQRLLNYVSELASGLKPLGTNDVTDQLVDLNTNSKRVSLLTLYVEKITNQVVQLFLVMQRIALILWRLACAYAGTPKTLRFLKCRVFEVYV